jgi:hypothetical protein
VFVQVVTGLVANPRVARAAVERWAVETGPLTPGWCGTTAGLAGDGLLVGVVRFADAASAWRALTNTDQRAWWDRASGIFTGPVVLCGSSDVVMIGSGSDDAGFVQVVQGRTRDARRFRSLTRELGGRLIDLRPDILGYLVALHDEGRGAFTEVAWFTSEEEARTGGERDAPEDLAGLIDEEQGLLLDLEYLDVPVPWLSSPSPARLVLPSPTSPTPASAVLAPVSTVLRAPR